MNLSEHIEVVIGSPFFILAVGVGIVLGMIIFLRSNAFLALLCAGLAVSFWAAPDYLGADFSHKVTRVFTAFGNMAGRVAVLIAMGAIIGKCMMKSGSADRIILALLRLFGEKRISGALISSGFVLSIPVFYDSTFYLLVPLVKSIYRKVRKNYILFLCAIGAGATISHTLIPPTPGPLAVAQALDVPIGTAMLIGGLVGACLCPFALAICYLINRLCPNPVIADLGIETGGPVGESEFEERETSEKRLPGLFAAFAPIVLPVVLIATQSFIEMNERVKLEAWNKTLAVESKRFQGDSRNWILEKNGFALVDDAVKIPEWKLDAQTLERLGMIPPRPNLAFPGRSVIQFLGKAEIALGLAALVSIFVLLHVQGWTLRELNRSLESTLMDAGFLILITSAGGAFGEMLRLSGIGEAIKTLFATEGNLSGPLVLILSFMIASFIKTAQGSSTAAMLTTAGVVSGLSLSPETLGYNMGYVAVAIGLGSMVTGWMNDSGFWLFSRMGGIDERTCLKTWSVMLLIMGICGLGIVLVLSRVLPLVSV